MKLLASAARRTRPAARAGKTLLRWSVRGLAGCAPSWGPAADAGAAAVTAGFDNELDDAARTTLVPLVYELLDAHADTAQLAGELERDPRWAAHLDYLRALQRTGREALAHSTVESPVSS